MDTKCPFCNISADRVMRATENAIALEDAFPVSLGHTLVIPRRHVLSFFDLEREEQIALLDLLGWARTQVNTSHRPAGFNIGINDGAAAGQTVMHLHIHLIPRYIGDTPESRGGIRWIFPEKAAYWEQK